MSGNGAPIGTAITPRVRRATRPVHKKEPTELFEVEDFTFSPRIVDLPKG